MENNIFSYTFREEGNIRIITTLACNFDCSYCICRNSLNKRNKYFSTKIAKKVVEVYNKYSFSKKHFIKFIWWEPLVNLPQLMNLVEIFSDINRLNEIEIATNGYFLNDNFVDFLLSKSYVNKISFMLSIDKDHSLFNRKLTDIVLNNFNNFKSKSKDKIKYTISYVISRNSYKDFASDVLFLVRNWVNNIYIDLDKHIYLNDNMLKTIIRNFYILKKELKDEYFDYIIKFDKDVFYQHFTPCGKWVDHYIDFDGNYIPCYSFFEEVYSKKNKKVIISNIMNINSKEEWNSLFTYGQKLFEVKPGSWKERFSYQICSYKLLGKEKFEESRKNIVKYLKFRYYIDNDLL